MKYFLFLLLSFPAVGLGQTKSATLKAVAAIYDARSKRIVLTCKLTNGDSAQVFYKPEQWNYCAGLSYLTVLDTQTQTQLRYFPCTARMDLDRVRLTATNSVALQPHASYTFVQYIKFPNLSPQLVKGHCYTVTFAINHTYLCGGDNCNVFTGSLRSNAVPFTVPK